MNFCPFCLFEIYLDPDEPHMLACILKYAIRVTFDGVLWVRWTNPMARRP